jgi:hypothetical protein
VRPGGAGNRITKTEKFKNSTYKDLKHLEIAVLQEDSASEGVSGRSDQALDFRGTNRRADRLHTPTEKNL